MSRNPVSNYQFGSRNILCYSSLKFLFDFFSLFIEKALMKQAEYSEPLSITYLPSILIIHSSKCENRKNKYPCLNLFKLYHM